MKKVLVWMVCMLILGVGSAQADLLQDKFGITLSSKSKKGDFTHSWAPVSKTADYIVHDNKFTPGAARIEAYDIEAMYFDDDTANIYFAIVTSLKPQGVEGKPYGYSNLKWEPGDISFNLGGGTFEYGLSTVNKPGKIEKNAKWQYTEGIWGFEKLGTPEMLVNTGEDKGYASYFNYYDTGIMERGQSTWVLEGAIDRGIFGSPSLGDKIGLRWSVSCNNDLVKLDADFDYNTRSNAPPLPDAVPEPATMMLLASGLIGMGGMRRMIKK